ncbi:MAG: MBL fold metallo-hydrolase [Clostridia bacterium]|nr:MBL fold metallo-hydrolase [Clostridia bacterium]
MQLKVLGTQSPYSTGAHHCPGFLVRDGQTKILLDCGSGIHNNLKFPDSLDGLTIVLSHLHRDHYNDIFIFQYASYVFHKLGRLKKPLDIYLPASPISISRDICTEQNAFAKYHPLTEDTKIELGNLTLTFCTTEHNILTFAVKVQSKNSSLVYTSDTSFAAKDKIADFAKGADLLICESSLLESYGYPEINNHLTAKQAATIALQAGVKKLALTHFWPEEDVNKYVREASKVFGNTIALDEGRYFTV